MKKRFLTGVLGILFAMTLAGCGNSGTYDGLHDGIKSSVKSLGNYTGLEYELDAVSISDEDVEQQISDEL
ncbi:MAG: hypothetical protein J6P60_02565, partial [Lachnospiraceae bacterium]|nr:hypothetical protein [Lachnospiraceae bacterium]